MNQIRIMSKNRLFPVAEDLYGLFYEDINRAGDSGIYPEMLRNRSFEDLSGFLGERIMSRLAENQHVAVFDGADYRKRNN